jgi:MFS family permease
MQKCLAVCGWVADQTSDRSVTYFIGLFILAAATLLFGIAKAAWILVLSRILQGLSAAIVYTVGLALLLDTVGQESIGQWMGTALSSSSFGLIVSPLLGGIVYSKAGYSAVFAMALGLIVVDIVMRMSMIEKRSAAKYLTQGSTTENSRVVTETHSHQHGNNANDSITGISPDTAEFDLQAGTVDRVEPYERTSLLNNHTPGEGRIGISKERTRLPPVITLLGSPRFLAAIYGIFVNVSILATFDAILPLFVKRTFHWDSLAAGLIFLCIAVPALAGPLVGKLSDRFGPRWIAVIGCSLTAVPLILMRLVEKESVEQEVLLCRLLIISGMKWILCTSFNFIPVLYLLTN